MGDLQDKLADLRDEVDGHPGLARKMAKYGAIGAVIAIPLPFVGPVIGGLAGAAYAFSQRDRT